MLRIKASIVPDNFQVERKRPGKFSMVIGFMNRIGFFTRLYNVGVLTGISVQMARA